MVVPVTGLGIALAVVATVGAVSNTLTMAMALIEPLVAVTVPLTCVLGAMNWPVAAPIVAPGTFVVQATVGDMALPNWSFPAAVNDSVPP